jgi:hypothetical protein
VVLILAKKKKKDNNNPEIPLDPYPGTTDFDNKRRVKNKKKD